MRGVNQCKAATVSAPAPNTFHLLMRHLGRGWAQLFLRGFFSLILTGLLVVDGNKMRWDETRRANKGGLVNVDAT